ncbi:MAG: type II secretion system protein [Akkermansiaceae bacterium]|jgi:prepilin-type N-terminal cleavage/methylation domain-containing protein|nr:type II secretion system protein [Akkermansiaceae bacterium]MBJ7394718.1 type II secretion system protein [Akkermansiaceae bacterium]MBJ7423321.1 type II secretion system protein [Akkermansiaceae bacterium]
MICPAPTVNNRGFLLLEMVLALAVFGIAATGFAVALNRMAKVAALAQSELRITRILDSALDETLSLPVLEEGVTDSKAGDTGVDLVTTIEPLTELQNEEGQLLQQMYLIKIEAKWFENSEWQNRIVETWRYGLMYQP